MEFGLEQLHGKEQYRYYDAGCQTELAWPDSLLGGPQLTSTVEKHPRGHARPKAKKGIPFMLATEEFDTEASSFVGPKGVPIERIGDYYHYSGDMPPHASGKRKRKSGGAKPKLDYS